MKKPVRKVKGKQDKGALLCPICSRKLGRGKLVSGSSLSLWCRHDKAAVEFGDTPAA